MGHAQGPGHTHEGAVPPVNARDVILVLAEVKLEVIEVGEVLVEVVVAVMMEVVVILVMFVVTAVIIKTGSPGPRVSQISNVFAAPSLPGGLSLGES